MHFFVQHTRGCPTCSGAIRATLPGCSVPYKLKWEPQATLWTGVKHACIHNVHYGWGGRGGVNGLCGAVLCRATNREGGGA